MAKRVGLPNFDSGFTGRGHSLLMPYGQLYLVAVLVAIFLLAGSAGSVRIVAAAYHAGVFPEPFDPPSQASQAKTPATDEKVHGPGQPSVEAILQLAERYQGEGKYGEAEALLKQALAMREQALRPDHPSMKRILYNLAMVDQSQGKYVEAEALLKRLLAMREKGLEMDEDSFWTIFSLAVVYRLQGKYGEAAALAKRELPFDEKALEPDDPAAMLYLSNRAMVYQQQGKYQEAETLYKRALAIDEKAAGPDHPMVAVLAENLALILRKLGRDSEARVYEEQAARIRAKIKPHSTRGGQDPE